MSLHCDCYLTFADPLQFLVRVKELEDQVSRLQTQKDDAQFQLENRDKMLEEYRSRLSVTQEQGTASNEIISLSVLYQ